MPTGDAYVNLALKRFLSQNRMSANFLDYTVGLMRDGISRIFPAPGLFTFPVAITTAVGSFSITTDPTEGIDAHGHVFILDDAAHLTNITFSNTVDEQYWLALHYIEVPDGITTNPRTGVAEYDKWMEEVGERDNPTSAADAGGKVLLVVDSLFPDGDDHSGRDVTVWLVNPISIDASVAIETVTVVYGGSTNTITTSGDLGQSTISENAADYQVVCVGVSIHNAGVAGANPFIAATYDPDEYTILGYITGHAATPTFTYGDQVDLSGGGGHTLGKAYDGLGGAGDGRIITVDDEAVELQQASTSVFSHDTFASALRITKDATTSLPGVDFEDECAVDVTHRFYAYSSYMTRIPLADFAGGDTLRIEETVTLVDAGNTISFTRGGADLDMPGNAGQLIVHPSIPRYDLVEISGSALGQDGVYAIASVASVTTLTVLYPDGTTPVFSLEVGLTARIYRQNINVGHSPQSILIRGANGFFYDDNSFSMGATRPLIDIVVDALTSNSDHIIKYYRDATGFFDLTADGDISTSGSIDADGWIGSEGDISAYGDVIADAEDDDAGDFKYGGPREYELILSPVDAQHDDVAGTLGWQFSGSSYPGLWSFGAGSPPARSVIPIHLPIGAIITQIESLINQDTTLILGITLYETTHDFGTPDYPSNSAVGASPWTDAATGTKIIIDSGAITVTIVEGRSYYLELLTADPDCSYYGSRLTYTVTTLKQPA